MPKVVIDKDICLGCGFCAANKDDLFQMDDDDKAVAVENDMDDMNQDEKDEVLEIIEGCPVGAIKVEE